MGRLPVRHTFEDAVTAVFEERTRDFSDGLRELLEELWREGVKLGIYLERERQPVPEGLFEKPPRRRRMANDPRREPGKLVQLREAKEKIVDQADELALEVEHHIDYEPTLALGGEELAKARHRYLQQTGHIERQLSELLAYVRQFRIHSF